MAIFLKIKCQRVFADPEQNGQVIWSRGAEEKEKGKQNPPS